MPTLADIYSAINTAKRKGSDFFQNPGTSLQQMLGDANDRARQFNEATTNATNATLQSGSFNNPESMALASQIAEGYSPAGMVKVNGVPSLNILFPNRTFDSLNSAEKTALTKFEAALSNPAVRRRESLGLEGQTELLPNIAMAERQIVTPEQMYGKVLVPVMGDTSATGNSLQSIAGVKLARPVNLQGGPDYMRAQQNIEANRAWASEPSAAISKQSNISAAGESGQDVLGVYTSMAPSGINFSHHVAESMIGQLPTLNPSKLAVKSLDNEIRKIPVINPTTGKASYPYSDFAGVTSENIYEQLANGTAQSSAGNLRKAIVETMSKAKYRDMGFPKWESVADAVIKPELRNSPAGMAGHSIFKGDPTQGIIGSTGFEHGSYSAGIPGQALGGMNQVPLNVMFPKLYAEQKALGRTDTQINRSFMMKHQQELADQQWLDNMMAHQNQIR
ncbi:MAG: hypothetical protein WCP79_11780 [Bacillota bacterium]